MSAAHVVLVTEGGPDVGLGHVSRCRALARAALARGARATVLLRPEPRAVACFAGLPVEVRPCAWTGDPAAAMEAVAALAPDAVAVDSYKATPELWAGLAAAAPTVLAVDDTAEHPLPVDVVVNGSIAAPSLPYRRDGEALLLLGGEYALLDPAYAALPARPVAPRVRRALVTLGGGLGAADLVAAVRAADAVLADAAIDVAAGPFADGDGALEAAARAADNRVVVHRDGRGLRELILAADLAVCGAGMTLYELAAAGTPAVTVCMADNQAPNARAFAAAGAAPAAGRAGTPDLAAAIEAALRPLAADPAARAAAAGRMRRLVDGGGAARVAGHLLAPARARR